MGLISWLKSKFSKKSSQEEKLEQTSEESINKSRKNQVNKTQKTPHKAEFFC